MAVGNYTVVLEPLAQRKLRKCPPALRARLEATLERLADDPRPPGCLKLTDRDQWRIRVGNYRLVYEIDDAARTVSVADLDHRSSIY